MESNFEYKDCEIQKIVNDIASSMQGRCYLEHQSRAIELMFDEERKSQLRSFKSEFDSKSDDMKKSEKAKLDELSSLVSIDKK